MKNIGYLIISLSVYVALTYIPGMNIIAFPIEILCTFLHEFGHAFSSIISGGTVHSLGVNMDGSGVTTTSGGSQGLTTMGGYVGSAVFGNIMLRMTKERSAAISLTVLSITMLISAVFWFDNIVTTSALIIFSVVLFLLSRTKVCAFVMNFLGAACIIYIIQDFNVGPSSDLQAYESEVGLFPAAVWMYIWLVIVIFITGFNLLHLFRTNTDNYEKQYRPS